MDITVDQVESLLYREAELLDRWKLREWAALFTADGEYLVPPTDLPDGEPGEILYLIYDDRHRLEQRAERLLKKTAHAEYPHSRTRHMISNVQIKETQGDIARVACNFVVYRSRADKMNIYPGHAIYELRQESDGELRIRMKKAILDTETLRLQNKLSIIL
ncbi:MAG: aromatic-ring-hydroxylating dioxygenase subunit beta [Noviherbaspirillum sp.]